MTSENQTQTTIAFVLYPGLTLLDLVGPLQVLRGLEAIAPQFRTVVVAERVEPITSDSGVTVIPNKTFDDVPHPDVLIVPGGGVPTIKAMGNEAIRKYVRSAAETAEIVGSVCTGALILASVGLLKGRKATTHWAFHKVLESLGVPYLRQRWVENDKFICSAGVSAGIDMGLYLVSRLTNEETARQVQLWMDYDPQPPLGRIDWNHLDRLSRVLRGVISLAAPVITLRPKLLSMRNR